MSPLAESHCSRILSMASVVISLGVLLCSQPSFALRKPISEFQITKALNPRVDFWKSIFLHHDDNTIVIHDRDRPWILIDVISFSELAKAHNDSKFLQRSYQAMIMENYHKRMLKAFAHLKEHRAKALRYGKKERRIYTAYHGSAEDLKRLYNGQIRIRMQRGLADSFVHAAKVAQDYLPYFEKEFREVGVPEELTRIAFVESMFNPHAISKVGASGMWQFMKATAMHFMQVDRKVDERHSPFKAARAAASLLQEDYKALGRWSLAVTAYNHGRGGIKRAIRQTGSRDIHIIIKDYKSPSFGFASANFYSEFLAVLHGYYELVHSQKISMAPSSLHIKPVHLKKPTRVKDLSRVLGVRQKKLEELNRCIKPATYKKYAEHVLPTAYRLYVPQNSPSLR